MNQHPVTLFLRILGVLLCLLSVIGGIVIGSDLNDSLMLTCIFAGILIGAV